LGATIIDGGANFSLFSRSAKRVELLFFDSEDDTRPERVIPIDPAADRTDHHWRAFVPSVERDKSKAIASV
jgi:isoamylase